jgi:hypothetical protein
MLQTQINSVFQLPPPRVSVLTDSATFDGCFEQEKRSQWDDEEGIVEGCKIGRGAQGVCGWPLNANR